MRAQRIIFYLICLSLLSISCNRIRPKPPIRSTLDSTLIPPSSVLVLPIHFPVKELEMMVNEKLGARIFQSSFAISANDSVSLTISRFKNISISYNGKKGLTYTLPIEVDGQINAKVAGIKIKNRTPVHAKILVKLFSNLELSEQWQLNTKTKLVSIKWIEEPKIKIAGVRFNLTAPIEKALYKNEDKLTSKLDETARQFLQIKSTISRLWEDIQRPIPINKKFARVWLKGDAETINSRFSSHSNDTLSVEVELSAKLKSTMDSVANSKIFKPLPKAKLNTTDSKGISAFLHVTIPFVTINEILNQLLDTVKISSNDYTIKIKKAEIYGSKNELALHLKLTGDVTGDIYLRGNPGFNSSLKQIEIKNFGFDIDSEHSLLNAADWLSHEDVVNKIKPLLVLPVSKAIELIPELITSGLKKGKIGDKINVSINDFEADLYNALVTKNDLQFIIKVKGNASIHLEKALFNKKRPA